MDSRKDFEEWYATNAFDYVSNPIGSRDCGLQWNSWQAACAHKESEFAKEREQLRAEIEKYRAVATDNKDWFDQLKESFDERGALIAMQAEALKIISAVLNDEHPLTEFEPECPYCQAHSLAKTTISTSAESVAAWEKEHELLVLSWVSQIAEKSETAGYVWVKVVERIAELRAQSAQKKKGE